MDRTPGCGPGGWRFESSRAHPSAFYLRRGRIVGLVQWFCPPKADQPWAEKHVLRIHIRKSEIRKAL